MLQLLRTEKCHRQVSHPFGRMNSSRAGIRVQLAVCSHGLEVLTQYIHIPFIYFKFLLYSHDNEATGHNHEYEPSSPCLIMLIQLPKSVINIIIIFIAGFYKTLTLASVSDFLAPPYLVPKYLSPVRKSVFPKHLFYIYCVTLLLQKLLILPISSHNVQGHLPGLWSS